MSDFKEGRKVQLVPFSPEHGEKVFGWYYDVGYKLFFRDMDQPLASKDFERFDSVMRAHGVEILTILEKKTGRAVGLMNYSRVKGKSGVAKTGILLDQSTRHQSYTLEAFIILCDYLYHRLGFNKLVVECLAKDAHVRRITEKGGWSFEGILKQEAVVDGKRVDEARYGLLKERFEELYGGYFGGS